MGIYEYRPVRNHNKTQQSMNGVHNPWDVRYIARSIFCQQSLAKPALSLGHGQVITSTWKIGE